MTLGEVSPDFSLVNQALQRVMSVPFAGLHGAGAEPGTRHRVPRGRVFFGIWDWWERAESMIFMVPEWCFNCVLVVFERFVSGFVVSSWCFLMFFVDGT